jgi:hypothetical protein
MIAYHTIDTHSLQTVLKTGLKRTSRGEKGDKTAIKKTDALLDTHRPGHLIKAQVSRDDNLYAYVADGNQVINITNGEKIDLDTFVERQDQAILQVTIDPEKCYISDIDLFDTIKNAVEANTDARTLRDLAAEYWQNLKPLKDFSINDIRRPEIMIPYDIPADKIKIIE